MNEVTLPPSPNWYLSSILACASNGTVAWGARTSIVIAKTIDDSKKLDFSIIDRAHCERVTSIAFSAQKDNDHYRLVSSGDENIVKLWNLKDLSLELQNSKLDNNHKIIGVDWSKYNYSLVCFISEDGLLVTWNINYDASQLINLGKMTATCLACCPHDGNIVAVGSKSGLIYIVDIRGSGNVTYKLRGHDLEIVSLSWCPVPENILEGRDTKELLLASGAKDRNIFLWKAGSDGRCQSQIPLTNAPLDMSSHKTRVSTSAGNYTAVCWLEPTILLSSSPWGELLLWDLSKIGTKRYSPQLVHAIHGKGLFAIAGLADTSIKVPEECVNENWRTKANLKAVWTLAQDRQVACCSIMNSEINMEHIIPTQGGFVYCISACPVDTSQIAFGVGDAMIRLWNLSEPHESNIELQMLWEKIKGKVSAVSWHPEKENLLAFATNEGRVGLFDTNVKKPPILYKQYHRRIVYRINWGPAPNVKEYALYTCGDGELVYYNPDKVNENPTSVTKKKDCTEFCWKPDYSVLALGFGDGSITFLNPDLTERGETIHTLNKLVQCLTWHPESTSSDLNISSMQNYLAVAMCGTTITIFDVSNNSSDEKETDKSSFYKTVATLNGHSEKVVCLAWSPHMSGYLVSGSFDCTAQVWKIETQEVIASYTSHLGPIQCCMWSPFSQDLIMTGAADFTLRMWSISKQSISIAPPTRTSMKGKRTKKKKTKGDSIDKNENETEPKEMSVTGKTNQQEKEEEISELRKTELKSLKKKKMKKITHFPGYAEINNDSKVWCSMVRSLLSSLGNSNQENEINSNAIENSSNGATNSNGKVPVLLGNKADLEKALNYEKTILTKNEQYNVVTEFDLWSGNLKENLQEAMKKKRLNDFLVSLAPSVSIELWNEMCEAYAMQLIAEENPHKAVSYLLCINKVYEAIDIFIGVKLYKEAYVLASLKLDPADPVIKNILRGWANNAQKDGHFQNVTECYIKLGDLAKAAKTLERRKDLDSLILAVDIAEIINDPDLITSLAEKAIVEALINSNVEAARLIIKKFSQIQFLETFVEVFNELSNTLARLDNVTIINWLKGSSDISILKTLRNRIRSSTQNYSLLIQKDICPIPTDEKMVQISVSHQLALSILSEEPKQQLQHILKAFDIIFQFEKVAVEGDKLSLLPRYITMIDDMNLTDSNSIFNSEENQIAMSLRAFLCHSIISWFIKTELNKEQISECMDSILYILEKCNEDLFNKEAIKFWTTTNEINKLETQLSLMIGKISNSEENQVDGTKVLVERLDQLKNDKKQFLNERISAPNPLLSYGLTMELISQIPDETARHKINESVMSSWKKSIS